MDSSPSATTAIPATQYGTIAAVTGASGFIGSYVCRNLLEHGYTVRACVRKNVPSKVDHLLSMAHTKAVRDAGGSVEICVADMSINGAYDDIFGNGCEYVFHVAGNFGTDYHLWKSKHPQNHQNYRKGRLPPIDNLLNEIRSSKSDNDKTTKTTTANTTTDSYYSYDHAVYESYVTAMEWILESVAKHTNTIRKFVYTSSGAAGATVAGPLVANDEKILDNSYGRAKHDCEVMLYDFCKNLPQQTQTDNNNNRSCDSTLVGVSVCPCIVLGPLMGQPPLHDTVYSHRLSDMLRGRYTLDQFWEITDVRDVAETHRLAAESESLVNGTRFWNGHDPGWTVSDMLFYVANHDDFRDEKRFVPILRNDSSCSESEDVNENGSSSSNESVDCKSNADNNNNNNNNNNSDRRDDGHEECSSSGSSSGSSSSEDSYGVSEWDDGGNHTTTWSDPIVAFDGYTPKTPQQTSTETAASIRERWTGLGRELTLAECSDYYTVAEMDGCDEEMEWLANEIRSQLATTND